jgi:hypothetical protein
MRRWCAEDAAADRPRRSGAGVLRVAAGLPGTPHEIVPPGAARPLNLRCRHRQRWFSPYLEQQGLPARRTACLACGRFPAGRRDGNGPDDLMEHLSPSTLVRLVGCYPDLVHGIPVRLRIQRVIEEERRVKVLQLDDFGKVLALQSQDANLEVLFE